MSKLKNRSLGLKTEEMLKTHPGFCIAAASKLSYCLKSEETEQNTVNFIRIKRLNILIPNPSFITVFNLLMNCKKIMNTLLLIYFFLDIFVF